MNKKQTQNNYNKKLFILKKTKLIVTKDGWSENIINELLKNGVTRSDIVFYFKSDYKKILDFSLENLNTTLENNIKKNNIINFPTNKRIKKILITRLKIIDEDKNFYKKTFYYLALPQNFKTMKKNLYKSVDTMWYLAGDDSTDFNFYTKRLILAVIYTNALKVFFNKKLDDVELNIDSNLKKISKIPKFKERFSFIKNNIPVLLRSFF